MKKSILTIAAALIIGIAVQAQDYNTGIGLRGGFSQGFTIKHFIGDNTAIEGIIGTYDFKGGVAVTGLYEIHARAFEVPGLNWYYGFGGHLAFLNENHGNVEENTSVLGIDGILGMEYNIEDIPINISVDWKPAFDIIGYTKAGFNRGALSVRYVF